MKKEIILFVVLIVCIIATGCDKNGNDMMVVDTAVSISYLDSNGQDLLDPETPNSYNIDKFKIYHYRNGEKILFYRWHLDYPYGFYIHKGTIVDSLPLQHWPAGCPIENYYLSITATNENVEARDSSEFESITLIELNANETDTINRTIRKVHNSLWCRKVLYNGILVWSWEDNTTRVFTIEKP